MPSLRRTLQSDDRQVLSSCVIADPEPNNSPRLNKSLIKALARALQWRRALETGEAESAAHLARKVGCTEGYVGRLLRLAFLAPGIVEHILEGRQPKALTLSRLLYAKLPLDWDAQGQVLGFPARSA